MKRWCPALTLVFLMLTALLPRASLAGTELYGGAGIGYSTFKIKDLNFEGAALATRQFVGFHYGDYVGLEFGFTDFGKVSDQLDKPVPDRVEQRGECVFAALEDVREEGREARLRFHVRLCRGLHEAAGGQDGIAPELRDSRP